MASNPVRKPAMCLQTGWGGHELFHYWLFRATATDLLAQMKYLDQLQQMANVMSDEQWI